MPMEVYHRIHASISFRSAWFCLIYLVCLFGVLLCFFAPITVHREYSGYWQDDVFVFYVPLEEASFVIEGEAFLANHSCEPVQLSYDTALTGILEAKTTCSQNQDTQVSIHAGTYTLFEILIQKWKGEL